jgi:hypothetical protein
VFRRAHAAARRGDLGTAEQRPRRNPTFGAAFAYFTRFTPLLNWWEQSSPEDYRGKFAAGYHSFFIARRQMLRLLLAQV